MKRQVVATGAAPKAIGPYSQAVWAGEFLFCPGNRPGSRHRQHGDG